MNRLVKCKEEGSWSGSSWRVGVGVARAWCGRVGAALCRARAAPPPLLRRLLAPQPAHLLAAADPTLEGDGPNYAPCDTPALYHKTLIIPHKTVIKTIFYYCCVLATTLILIVLYLMSRSQF